MPLSIQEVVRFHFLKMIEYFVQTNRNGELKRIAHMINSPNMTAQLCAFGVKAAMSFDHNATMHGHADHAPIDQYLHTLEVD